jgi:hypothetical protein
MSGGLQFDEETSRRVESVYLTPVSGCSISAQAPDYLPMTWQALGSAA